MPAFALSILLLLAACGSVTTEDSSACEEYCENVTASCSANAQYPSAQACVAYCSDFANLPLGAEDDQSGNSVACRNYHAIVASSANPELHCPHAGRTGAQVCGSLCENYCHLMVENCAVFDDAEQCNNLCDAANIPDTGGANDEAGDSIQCRIRFAGLAGTEEATNSALCTAAQIISPECR